MDRGIKAVGSFFDVPMSDYHEIPSGTPGWQFAPVPGWGKNPYRAGPPRVGVGAAFSPGIVPVNQNVLPRYAPLSGGCGCGSPVGRTLGQTATDAYKETSWGHVMFAAAGGIALGVLFGRSWWKGAKR